MIHEQERPQEAQQGAEGEGQSETSSKQNEQSSIYYTKNKKIIFWLYLLLCVAFVVSQATLISLNWRHYNEFSTSDNFYLSNQITYEWQQGFVTDVLVTASATCPDGYQKAFAFEWPGTSYGCFCRADANSSFVLEGYCSPKLIQASCRNMQSRDQITAEMWRGSSRVCIKRSGYSFFNQKRYDGSNKICGNSRSLTIVPQNEPCPIVNLTASVPSLEEFYRRVSDPSSLMDPLYATYNSTSPYSFYAYPVSKFTVSQYEYCLIDEDSGVTPENTEFILLKRRRGCVSTGSYQTMDSMTELEFYQNNPQLGALSSVEGFPKPGNWRYNLGFASLPSWTYNCRHNFNQKFAIPTAVRILNFEFFSTYYYVALCQIVLLSVMGFQTFVLAVRRLLKREVFPVGYRQMYLPEDFCVALARYLLDLTCKLGLLGLLLYASWVTFVNWNWLKSSLNMECPDGNQMMIANVMEPFRDMYEASTFFCVAQLVVFLFVGAIDIVHFVYVYRNDLKYYLVNSQGKALIQHSPKDDLDWINNKEDPDRKLMIQNVDKLNEDAASQKFRVTMAMNVFENEREQSPMRSKIVKKKKKKRFGQFSKDYQNQSIGASDEFNPFSIDDPTIIGLDSIENITGERAGATRNQAEDENNPMESTAKRISRRKKK